MGRMTKISCHLLWYLHPWFEVSAAAPVAVPIPSCTAGVDSITVKWNAHPRFSLYYVQLSTDNSQLSLSRPYALQTTKENSVVLQGLVRNVSYTIALRALPVSAPSMAWGPAWLGPSQPVECRTGGDLLEQPTLVPNQVVASTSSRFMYIYRISEYSFDVDFLDNHDTASIDAMPLYVMTCATGQACSPWDVKTVSPNWDQCHRALEEVCPNSRGQSFNCMMCADTNRQVLTDACGEFSNEDTLEGKGSFAIHWWCGIGWPEGAPEQGPITEYCVEYQPLEEKTPVAPQGAEGFSEYLSCNSDEVDGALGNDPRDPSCICIVLDDRLLGHQTNDTLKKDCYDGTMSWVGETRCNCTGQEKKSVLPQPGNPSLTHVGRMPVWLPYVGINLEPYVPGTKQIESGFNYHFPKAGACAEGEPLGTDGCTWRRAPLARMIYGSDLLDQGWDREFVADTAENQSHTLRNVAAFKAAIKNLNNKVQASPCGAAATTLIV